MRKIARFGVPIGVVAGLLALGGAVALIINIAVGAGAWSILTSVAMIAFWAPIAHGVGIELRRSVREWDRTLAGHRVRDDRR